MARENVRGEVRAKNARPHTKLRQHADAVAPSHDAGEASRDGETLFQSLFTTMVEGYFLGQIICDDTNQPVDFIFREVNPAFEAQTGLSRQQVIDRRVKEVLPQVEDYWITGYGRVALTGEPARFTNYSKELDRHFSVVVHRPQEGYFAVLFLDVTAQKKNEAGLQRDRQRFQLAMTAADIGTWEYTYSDNICRYDPRAQVLYGLDQSDYLHDETGVKKLIHPQDIDAMWQAMQQACNGEMEGRYDVEYRVQTADGGWRWLRVWGITDFEGEGESRRPVRIIGASRDITPQKETEQALRESEERYRRVVETAQEGIWIIDADGRTTYVNDRMSELLGYSRDEIMARVHTDFMWEEDRPKGDVDLESRRQGTREVWDQRYRRKDGTELWTVASCNALYDSTGNFLGALGMFTDITARKQAENAVRASEERYRLISRATNDLTWELDFVTNQAIWGDMVGTTFGYLPDQLPPTYHIWLDHVHPDDRERVAASLRAAIHGAGEVWTEQYRFRCSDGSYRAVVDRGIIARNSNGQARRMIGAMQDVSAIVRADEAFRENERRLRRLFEIELIGMVYFRMDGPITDANEAFLKITGYTAADLQSGKVDWAKMTPEEYRHLDDAALRELRETGRDQPYEKQFIRKDGSRVWVLVGAAMFGEDDGVGYVLDVTGRHEAEDRFQTLADNMPQLAWITDSTGSIYWYNRRWYEYTGTRFEQMRGWGWQAVHHPDHVDRVLKKVSHCFETGEVWEDTFPLRGADGQYRWFLSRAIPVRDESGKVIRWFGTNTDITEQQQIEQALDNALSEAQRRAQEAEEGKRLLDAVMEHVPVGITIADARAVNIRMVSKNGQALLGKPADQIRNIPFDEHAGKWGVFHTDGVTPAKGEELPLTRATLHGEQVRNEEWLVQTAGGKMTPILCDASPIRDRDGTITGGIIVWRDITELREARAKAEQHLKELEQAIKEAESANRAKDQFLAVLSHELRTPLMPVLGATSLMLANSGLPNSVREDVEMIRRNVELEAKIIDDLLDVTRITSGKLQLTVEDVDLHLLIQNVMQICAPEIEGKSIRAELGLNAEPCFVRGDSTRLQQVLWNLIRNAAKFTAEHGTISIRTSCDDSILRLEVEDNGRGIDPQMLSRIFNAFDQGGAEVSPRFGGMGLGLAISKGIIDAHGGSITADSAGRGKGALFAVELAAVMPEPQKNEADSAPREQQQNSGRRRVLLVEDHESSRKIMARLLRQLGHEVQVADSIKSALEAAAKTSLDLVISDIGLPDGHGTDLMRELRRLYGVHGIALTGFGSDTDIAASHEAGFHAHLTKPVAIEKLQEIMDDLFNSSN
jgi:PAS domain S-box-containing protein